MCGFVWFLLSLPLCFLLFFKVMGASILVDMGAHGWVAWFGNPRRSLHLANRSILYFSLIILITLSVQSLNKARNTVMQLFVISWAETLDRSQHPKQT